MRNNEPQGFTRMDIPFLEYVSIDKLRWRCHDCGDKFRPWRLSEVFQQSCKDCWRESQS